MNEEDKLWITIIILAVALIVSLLYIALISSGSTKSYQGVITKIDGNNITFDSIITFHIASSSSFDYYLDKEVLFEYYIKDGLCWPSALKEL